MVYIDSWDEFQKASEELYLGAPLHVSTTRPSLIAQLGDRHAIRHELQTCRREVDPQGHRRPDGRSLFCGCYRWHSARETLSFSTSRRYRADPPLLPFALPVSHVQDRPTGGSEKVRPAQQVADEQDTEQVHRSRG
ncbi:hypothetical protein BC936DRAFT_140016 [Jimgerdemannia flammicorona]|uniref:Uncharacterized protein n=1 Tax=Jimgerdemannia flammicorona TaxID=994334 RepID=A0A433DH51_9FUNG|nr:hypothetical protein BC936DRAFT_140016 [Jimgerdemannia flammicorona]